jgi:flagellar basal body P-ring formation protein FlgA
MPRPSTASASIRHPVCPQNGRRSLGLRRATTGWAWGLVFFSGTLLAQSGPIGQNTVWETQARHWLEEQMSGTDKESTGLRPEVLVGELDKRLRLAPCQNVTPYIPQNTRLWGRTRIGLRCDDGRTAWNVFLPVTVKAWGPAWVINKPLASGATLTQDDAELTEIDWAESVSPVLARQDDWVGSQANRALVPGQVLRQALVRSPQVFQSGSQVKVKVLARNFQLAASGQALTHGRLGELARVKMPNGKIVQGTVRDEQTVEVAL